MLHHFETWLQDSILFRVLSHTFFFLFVPWWNLTNFCFFCGFFLRRCDVDIHTPKHVLDDNSSAFYVRCYYRATMKTETRIFFPIVRTRNIIFDGFCGFFSSLLSSEWTGLTEWEWTTTLIIIAWTHSHEICYTKYVHFKVLNCIFVPLAVYWSKR